MGGDMTYGTNHKVRLKRVRLLMNAWGKKFYTSGRNSGHLPQTCYASYY